MYYDTVQRVRMLACMHVSRSHMKCHVTYQNILSLFGHGPPSKRHKHHHKSLKKIAGRGSSKTGWFSFNRKNYASMLNIFK